MLNEIKVGSHRIGETHPPFIIAEMSGNHRQSLNRALEIVDAAAAAGVHALKLQTYTAETMTLNVKSKDFVIRDPKSLWNGNSLYDLYQRAHTPWEWHKPIFDRCKKHDLIAFSTPFDCTAVDFLEKLNVPAYKIASFENADIPLIRRIAKTGKPIILSTGLASIAELAESVATLRAEGCRHLVMLKCTSAYPAPAKTANLMTIPHLQTLFECHAGLSDHTLGTAVSVAAVALGATVIEKHMTLSRTDGAVDSAFSMEPQEMQQLVSDTCAAWEARGVVHYGPSTLELPSLKFRRSIYIARPVRAGERVTARNIQVIRPSFGLAPKFYDVVLGRRFTRACPKGTPLAWDLLK